MFKLAEALGLNKTAGNRQAGRQADREAVNLKVLIQPMKSMVNFCLPACLPACLPIYLPACLSVCLPAYLSACLSICLPLYDITKADILTHGAEGTRRESDSRSEAQSLAIAAALSTTVPSRSRTALLMWLCPASGPALALLVRCSLTLISSLYSKLSLDSSCA